MFGRKKSSTKEKIDEQRTIGSKVSFAASEAYKLLRTNVSFSFPDTEDCRVIGVTSSVKGEGKSTTAINLAYSLAENGSRVLLIEGDMRLPTLKEKMRSRSNEGLADLLTGHCDYEHAIDGNILSENLSLMTSGSIPPNPSELLGSEKMANTIKELSERYDYMILDLPPISSVADALVVSKLIDGIIIVARSGMVTHRELNNTLRQLDLINVRVLGFVMTMSGTRKGYYRNYYRGYYKKYKKYEAYDRSQGAGTGPGRPGTIK